MEGSHMHVGGERCGQDQNATGLQQAREFIQGMGRFRHVLQHLAAEDGIKTGIGRRNLSDVADQINPRGIPTFGLQTLVRVPPPAPWYSQKSWET